jgi:hypothetical protein
MNRPLSVLILSVGLIGNVLASPVCTQTPSTVPSASTSNTSSDRSTGKVTCSDNGTYTNSQGEKVKRPEACSGAPTGATAQCQDGTYSFSRNRRGTCSHHGGVAKWI